jgi:uncharacterized membrane-anchored protein
MMGTRITAITIMVAPLIAGVAQAQIRPEISVSAQTAAQGTSQAALPWMTSGRGPIGGLAGIDLPNGLRYLPALPSERFLQMMGNPPISGLRVVAPNDLSWFIVYSYHPEGHVTDGDELDSRELMTALLAQEKVINERRVSTGLGEIHIAGWDFEPQYDRHSNTLQWGLEIRDASGRKIINRTVRILGREGYVAGTLVVPGDAAIFALRSFEEANRAVSFDQGSTYQEFRQGDRIAEYGLAALVTGGVTAAAIKSGAARSVFSVVLGGIEGIAAMLVAAGSTLIGALAAFAARMTGGRVRE